MAQDDARLRKLETQRAELDARIQRIKAQSRERERKLETRKKILVGSAVLDSVARGELSEGELQAMLSPYLERDIDRELFGLPKRVEGQAAENP